jgi:hypothetical protein
LAETADKTSRALAGVQTGIRPLKAGMSSIRPCPIVGVSTDAYHRDAEIYSDRGPMQDWTDEFFADLEYPYDGEITER